MSLALMILAGARKVVTFPLCEVSAIFTTRVIADESCNGKERNLLSDTPGNTVATSIIMQAISNAGRPNRFPNGVSFQSSLSPCSEFTYRISVHLPNIKVGPFLLYNHSTFSVLTIKQIYHVYP